MVKFWAEMRKREKLVCQERIKHAEKHGLGKMAIEEKARLQKLNRMIEEQDK